jgi:hypothetical protein
LHVIPSNGYQFCTLEIAETHTLLCNLLSPAEDEWKLSGIDFAKLCQGAAGIDTVYELCETLIDSIRCDSGIDWTRTEQALRQAATPAYSALALVYATAPQMVATQMAVGGFWTLFGGDTAAVEQLARLSCWSSLCLAYDLQDNLCRENGFTLEDASDRLLRYCESTGFRFFALGQDRRPISLA